MRQEEKNLQQHQGKETGESLQQPVQHGSSQKVSATEPENEIDRFEGNMDHGELGGNLNSNNKNYDHEERTGKN